MTDVNKPRRISRIGAAAAIAVGLAAGSYGIAAAAGSSSSSTPAATQPAAPAAPSSYGNGPSSGQPWGRQRSDETLLSGDALSKVTAIAKNEVPGGTIVRVETDADGHAAYEAHMTKSDRTPVTVYVDKNFRFVSMEAR